MGTHGRIARWGRAVVALAVATTGLAALTAAPAQAASPLVVSLTFDDGLAAQYRAASILEAHGARGTFYLNSGAIDQRGGGGTMGWSAAQDLAARGHEIGGHTRDHVNDTGLSDQDRWTQICEDRIRLVEMGLHPTSFSYTYGAFSQATKEAVIACGYQTARTAGGLLPTGAAQSETVPPALGAYQIRALGATHNGPVTLEDLQAAVDAASAAPDGSWLPMLFHWVCEESDTACLTNRTRPISATVLDEFLTWLEDDPRDITVEPLSEVINQGAAVPTITITEPIAGGGTAADPLFTGSTSADGPVEIEVLAGPYGLGSPVATVATVATGQRFEGKPAEPLPEGVYSVRASVTAGGVTGTSVPVPFRVGPPDTTAPAPAITTPVEGANMSGSPASFTGTATTEPGDHAYARVLIEGSVTRDLRVSIFPGGKWSITPTLPNGTYTVRVTQSDRSGNTGTSAPVNFTVGLDRQAPVVTITEPTEGSFVPIARPTIAGAGGTEADDDDTVTVRIHAGSAATPVVATIPATIGADGSWSVTPTEDLPDGTYTVQATQTDGSGNTGTATRTFTVKVPVAPPADTTAPVVRITAPAEGATVTTRRPAITGTGGTAIDDVDSVTVHIHPGSSTTAPAVAAIPATVGADGSWSVTPTEDLPDGTYTVQANQADGSGNTGTAPRTFTVKVPVAPPADTTAPDVRITEPAEGATLTTRRPTVSGTRGTASGDLSEVVVKLYAGTAASGTPLHRLSAMPSTGGTWSATPTADLPDGTYTVQASQDDEAGNTGVATRTFTVKMPTTPPGGGGGGGGGGTPPPADTTAPDVRITEPAEGATLTTRRPTVSGTRGTATGDLSQVVVKLYQGTTTAGTPLHQLAATPSTGGTWSATTTADLPDGTYTVQASQADGSGNTGTATRTFTVKMPVAPPAEDMVIDSVSRLRLPQGATGLRIVVEGAGFGDGIVPVVTGEGVTITSTQLLDSGTVVMTVDVAEGSVLGTRDLVLRAEGLDDATCAACLRVTPGPKLRGMSSDTVGQGARKAVIRLFGKFRRGATVGVSGEGIRVIKVLNRRPRALTLGLWVRPGAPVGARDLTVRNGDGGRVTCAGCLTVAPAPRATSLPRDAVARGGRTWVTVLGSGFTRATVAAIRGRGVRVDAVKLVNSGRLRLAVHVAPKARPRARHLVLVDQAHQGRSVLRNALRIT